MKNRVRREHGSDNTEDELTQQEVTTVITRSTRKSDSGSSPEQSSKSVSMNADTSVTSAVTPPLWNLRVDAL